jgi:hypothetical protein
MSGPGLLGIFVAAILVSVALRNLWNADLSPDDELAESSYKASVRVTRRFSPRQPYGPLSTLNSGFLGMDIRGSRIRIGTSTNVARVLVALLGLSYRLDASRFQITRERIRSPPGSFRRPADGVVLRGRNHHRRYAEFTLVPRDGDVNRLFDALERAGAREGGVGGTTVT